MKAIILPEKEVQWIKDHYDQMTIVDMAKFLEVSTTVVKRYMNNLHLDPTNQYKQRAKLGIDITYGNNVEESVMTGIKIKKLKKEIVPGLRIGKYIVIKPYTHHCLLRHNTGYCESFSYADLASMIKVKNKK